jgi:hypothetical protein
VSEFTMKRSIASTILHLALGIHAGFPGAVAGQQAGQEPTRLVVRAVSHDAKVIGTSVGGARITVRDLETGRELASGVQEGGTGSTPLIVQRPRERGASVYEGSASFTATLPLERPTRVEVVAEGPLRTPYASQRASKTLLLVPGRHVEGDGLILELHGFTVEILAPEATSGEASSAGAAARARGGEPLTVLARVTMLCGCPTEPGGTWDADRMDISARLIRDGRVVARAPLAFAGQTSTYTGTIVAPEAGTYQLEVLAVDKVEPNAGMATIRVVVER